MNLFDLGGQLLRVGRAVTPPGDRNLGAGGVPQAMPRFDHLYINIQALMLSTPFPPVHLQ